MFAMQRVAYLVQKVCQGVCVCIPFLSLWPVGTLRVRGGGNEQEFFFCTLHIVTLFVRAPQAALFCSSRD